MHEASVREFVWRNIEQKSSLVHVQGSGLSIIRAPTANQNVTNNIPREKPKERPPCLTHKLILKHRNRRKAGGFDSERNLQNESDARSSMTNDISCKQIRRITFICTLESDSNYRAFHQSTPYHTAVRAEACESAVSIGGRGMGVGLELSTETLYCRS